jgi:hypothetical protein
MSPPASPASPISRLALALRKRATLAMLAMFAALATTGCAPQDGTGTSGGTSPGSSGTSASDGGATTTAGQACLDTAAAFATAAKRCGGNYDAEHAAFIRDLAGGDCNSVSIRNESELRRQCLPSLTRITCDALTNQRFDPSCAEQVISRR